MTGYAIFLRGSLVSFFSGAEWIKTIASPPSLPPHVPH